MSFIEEFDKIENILKKKCDINLVREKYDALIVKGMSATNCIGESLKSHQSHIAITGKQMNLFPYIYQKEFIEKNNKKMKNFFVFKAPVNIFMKNCYYLDKENNIDFNGLEIKNEEMCVYPRSGGTQVQLSMKNQDTPDFITFRELIKPQDYFIVLKYKERLEYDILAIKQRDGENVFYEKSIFEYDIKGNTFISNNNVYYDSQKNNFNNNAANKLFQKIFFGAPGTGKSFKLNKETEEYFGSNYERVTFHPNYMYGNFVGSFKPFPYFLKDSDGSILTDKYGNKKESITYKYVEGAFMRILVKAFKNPETNYLLLIEEINRANTAAVFGDFFQLLDRNIKGESEYPISTSEEVRMYLDMEFSDIDDEEIRKYIDSKIGNNYERLILPSNLYIWATMNSADQGVMPMDTAFKRRWDFEYIGIDEVLEDKEIAKKFEDYKFRITKDRIAKWNDFRVEVNKRLSECRVPEDKLIGPYFISKSVLESGDINKITNTIKNKVLMYLYEDAGKPYRNSIFLHEKSRTYSELCKNFDENGSGVFKIAMDIGEEISTEEDKQTEDSLSEYKLKEDGMEGMVAEDNN